MYRRGTLWPRDVWSVVQLCKRYPTMLFGFHLGKETWSLLSGQFFFLSDKSFLISY